jgi:hypothetical protein
MGAGPFVFARILHFAGYNSAVARELHCATDGFPFLHGVLHNVHWVSLA